jgi:trimethylamine--corrinoid protein Co-methyltransferase
MFATGMTCSHEQLIMDEEISAMSRRIARGVRVDKETIARDLIEEIGPRGETYLTSEHTLNWLHSDEYLPPRVSVRGSRAVWEAAGSKDTCALAGERAKALMADTSASLSREKRAVLEKIIRDYCNNSG